MKTYQEVPTLIIIFNRPDKFEQLINSLKEIKPSILFIAGDGPRSENEKMLTDRTRILISNIDWECEIKTLFQDINLGCKVGVSSAITWFFKHVEAGVILEDDCIPTTAFFQFMHENLIKYQSNGKIFHISGCNLGIIPEINEDYYFSKIVNIWGWGTWARAWKYYDIKISDFSKNNNNKFWKKFYFPKKYLYQDIVLSMHKTFKNKINTWDYQWVYTIIKNDKLAILPKGNFTTNIGFGVDATHTTNISDQRKWETTKNFNKLINHPGKIERNLKQDIEIQKKLFPMTLKKQIKNFIKSLLM